MSVRIVNALAKVATVVGWSIGTVFAAIALALAVSRTAADIWSVASLLALVVFSARTFRGAGEDVAAPRRWWRMTTRPLGGFVIAALIIADALVAAAVPAVRLSPGVEIVAGVLGSCVALAYVHSSLRLLRAPRPVYAWRNAPLR